MTKLTKIVATVSDLRCEKEFVQALYDNGMNVARMNSAHLDADGFNKIITNIRSVSNQIAILMDTKGPELRTTTIADEGRISFQAGDRINVYSDPSRETTTEGISVNYPGFVNEMHLNAVLLIDDGELEFRVVEKYADHLVCEAQNAGELGARKSINIPGVRINLPSLTEKDIRNIKYGIEHNIDFIAHSFVRCKQDILDIQAILDEYKSPIKIIAKIENQEGVDNIAEILEVTYGVMIARGDLGIEVAQEKIPGIQRQLIRKCVQAKKPVIVATQMLHSMIKNPRPTRAEVTDIANAIYYRTDALMLSGETAYGKYPIEAIATMSKIAEEAEKTKMSENDIKVWESYEHLDTRSFLAKQAVKSTIRLNYIKAILTDSYSGETARNIAAYRSSTPTLALCYRERTMRELALSYGVFPIYQPQCPTTREYLFKGLKMLMEKKWITMEDSIAYLGGGFGEGGGTTFLEINEVKKMMEEYSRYVLPNMEETDCN